MDFKLIRHVPQRDSLEVKVTDAMRRHECGEAVVQFTRMTVYAQENLCPDSNSASHRL